LEDFMQTDALASPAASTDTFPINGTDYVEFYVGNAKQASHYYRTAFGFQLVGYRGPETGTRDRASYLLQQNKVRLIVTSPLTPEHPAASHVALHGDGVRDIALWVDNAREAFEVAIERGARAAQQPTVLRDDAGEVVIAAIHTYGSLRRQCGARRNEHLGQLLSGRDGISEPHLVR
jgi:4-hydroxyphenylpyruvate dioxygenase